MTTTQPAATAPATTVYRIGRGTVLHAGYGEARNAHTACGAESANGPRRAVTVLVGVVTCKSCLR